MAGFSINRKELYEEIWSSSVSSVAEKHEISYTRLLSACRKNNIPVPPRGYSTRLDLGRPVERIPLPESSVDDVVIELPSERRKKFKSSLAIDVDDRNQDAEMPEEGDDQDKVPLLRYEDQRREEREVLYQKVWEKPVSEVAKEYHISDAALRKRCSKLEVPLPERGYWARLRSGKKVTRMKLPKLTHHFPKPLTGEKRKLHIGSDALSFMRKDGRFEILNIASLLRVGGPGSKLLDEIQKLQNDYKEWHKPLKEIYMPGGLWIHEQRKQSNAPLFAKDFSPKTSSRVFHILDALTKALLPYSGSISCRHSFDSNYIYSFHVNREIVSFFVSEEKNKVVHEITQEERLEMLNYREAQKRGYYASEPQIPCYDEIWSGRLKMTIADNIVFEDCRAYVLEDRIGEILIALYEASYPARLRRLQEEEQLRKEIEEWERIKAEDERKEMVREQYKNEIEKTKMLINMAMDYEKACSVRRLIEAVRENPDNPDNNPEWLEWAAKKADWLDPTIAREDEFLGKRKQGSELEQKEIDGW